MDVLFNASLLVFLSEMGDKTQLLALVLATRFKKPWAIMAGIFVATVLNHGLASWAGGWISLLVSPGTLSWILAATFFGFGLWILIPDKEEEAKPSGGMGAFLTTAIAFYFAEMGDKTQLATVAIGAKYNAALLVTIGTTIGMLGADGLAVFLGEKLTTKISMVWIRRFASLLFVLFGLGILMGW